MQRSSRLGVTWAASADPVGSLIRVVSLHRMPTVHIFASCGRFASGEALKAFVIPTYSEDGDRIDSAFMREVGFTKYESMCIEAIHSEVSKPLSALLARTS